MNSTSSLRAIRDIVDVGHNIAQHDWIQFADAMSGIPDIVRRDITNISENQAIMTTGDEKVFWRCMYNAVR